MLEVAVYNTSGEQIETLQVDEAIFGSTVNVSLVKQAVDAQQSLSGVNLDEEAANLIRFQQAYQASGKVLQIASKLFDTILEL